MTHARIRFEPDILRRLGEELNPHPSAGIIELVKNAYDADAVTCSIQLHATDEPGGEVRVEDDGDGMSLSDIRNGWLVVGQSEKTRRRRTRLGRIPAGSKGLGRLAALRLGNEAHLKTRPRQPSDAEFSVSIDWDAFDSASLVDDVVLDIRRTRRRSEVRKGTQIMLRGLHSNIGRMEVKRLARAMLLLADPFGDDPAGFQPQLKAPEFTDLESLVQNRYFEDASYHLIATVDRRGRASASVVDFRGNELFAADHADIGPPRNDARYECPALDFGLWVFILDQATFATRNSTLQEVKEWLHEFGGVHVYQNGLRVSPYGDPGNDWLDMNLRRTASPEERPSTNTSIGKVNIHDPSEVLIQKTDRSGFIETEAFDNIRGFARDAMEWLAARRLDIAERRRAKARAQAPRRAQRSKKKLDEAIEKAPDSVRPELEKAAEAYERSREREVGELRKEVQLYRTLSTAGITAATFAHESTGNPIKVITNSTRSIERRLKQHVPKKSQSCFAKPVTQILKAINGLGVLGAATLKLLDHCKRRASRVDIHTVLRNVLETYEPFMEGRGVKVATELVKGSPYLMGSEAALESIITNLVTNSLVALESRGPSNRQIMIRTTVEDETVKLTVSDSGAGITDIRKQDIWLPGKTTRKNGTGLGLTIVRDTALDLGGAVDAVERGALGGAEVIVELPIIGV